jgi:hypothetical protein
MEYQEVGQAEVQIVLTDIQVYAQADSQILTINYAVGNSVTQILATYSESGQALAIIQIPSLPVYFYDSFTRTTTAPPANVGTADTGQTWYWNDYDENLGFALSTLHVESGALVLPNEGPAHSNYDAINGAPSIEEGEFLIDFWVPAAGDIYLDFRWFDKNWYIVVFDTSETTFTLAGDIGETVSITGRDAWYRLRVIVEGSISSTKAHIWKIGETEPITWTQIQSTWKYIKSNLDGISNYGVPYRNLLPIFDIYNTPLNEAAKFDNITVSGYGYTVYNQGFGLAQTQILTTYNIYSQADSWTVYRQETGEYIWPQFGQAYAHILTIDVQAYSQALAMIALQRYTTTFSDTFSRVTTPNPFNLGTSDSGHTWNWSNWASSTPPTAIYTDGSNLIFTSGGNSAYTIYPSGPSPSSGSNYVDLLYDIWITNSYDSNHYFYWFEKDWWFYIYDNSGSTFGIWSYGGSGGYAVIRNSFYRVRAIYDPTGPGGIYLKAHMWKVGDAEPGTWTTLQVQKVYNYNSPGNTYYNQSPILYWGKPSSEAGKLDNIAYNSVYNTVYNQGQAQAQTNILTTYQQYGQAHVTLNQSQYTGQALASILSVYQNYSQAQANIRKSAGYGQARALLNRHWAFAIATFYSFNPTPGAINKWNNHAYAQAHIVKRNIRAYGLTSVLNVYRNPVSGAYIWPKFAQANTKIILTGIQKYGQAQAWMNLIIRPAQAIAQIINTDDGYRRAVLADLPMVYYPLDDGAPAGTNLVRFPVGGSASYTGYNQYSASYAYAKAADGIRSDGWAASGYASEPPEVRRWWQVDWTVPQTIKTVRLINRPSYTFGYGRIIFSDGTYYSVTFPNSGNESQLYFVDVTNVTSMRIISDGGGNSNPGFSEVEAYIDIEVDTLHSIVGRRNASWWYSTVPPSFSQTPAILSGTSIYFGNNKALDAGQNMWSADATTTLPLAIPGQHGQENNMNVISPTWWGKAGDVVTIHITTPPTSADIGIYQVGGENQWWSKNGYQTTGGLVGTAGRDVPFTLTSTGPHFVYLWTYNAGYTGTGTVTITGSPIAPESTIPMAAGSAITVETWVKWDGTTDYRMILGFDNYNFSIFAGKLGFEVPTNQYWSTASAVLIAGVWYHVAAVMYTEQPVGTANKIYVNGVLQSLSGQNPTGYFQEYFNIGGWSASNSYNVYSTLDEYAVFNYELTAEQILAHYQARIIMWHAQAQARIIGFGYPVYAQALAMIKGLEFAQAQAHIFGSYPRYGQALGLITRDGEGLVRMIWTGEYTPYPENIIAWGIEDQSGQIYYDNGGTPVPDYPGTNAGAAWTTRFTADATGTWSFRTVSDDNSEVTIDSVVIVANYSDQFTTVGTGHGDWDRFGPVELTLGQEYNLHVRWTQGGGPYTIHVYYKRPADSTWNLLLDNKPPWLPVSKIRVWAQAQAQILRPPNIRDYAQAQARILAYKVKGYGQAQSRLLAFNQNVWGQALAFVGHFQSGNAQARILAFNINKYGQSQANILKSAGYGQAQAKLNAFNVNRYAIAHAKLRAFNVNGFGQARVTVLRSASGLTQARIKQTYPLFYLNNYALSSLGATATALPAELTIPNPNDSNFGGPINTIDGNSLSLWESLVNVAPENDDERVKLIIDLGQHRVITGYYILPDKYNSTVSLQWHGSPGNTIPVTQWVTIVPNIYLPVNISTPLSGDNAVRGFIAPSNQRWWRLIVTNGGDGNRISLATFGLGVGLIQSGTFAQAMAMFGHYAVAQAAYYISPAFDQNVYGQAQADIVQTYQIYGQSEAWLIPPTQWSQALAQIIQTYALDSNAMAWIIPPTQWSQALATIKAYDIEAYGFAKAHLIGHYARFGNARTYVSKTQGYAHVAVSVFKRGNIARGGAIAYIGHFQFAQAGAFILWLAAYSNAQAQIKTDYIKSAQAIAVIQRFDKWGLAKVHILQDYRVYSQSIVLLNRTWGIGLANSQIHRTYYRCASTRTWIKDIYRGYAQTEAWITLRNLKIYSQARTFVVKTTIRGAQAQVQIGGFQYSQAQARILAYNVPKVAQSAGYILANINIVPPIPTSGMARYLVQYNGHLVPGYAQSESYDSIANTASHYTAYFDSSLSEYIGLENKIISLTMKVWEPTYLECKLKVQEAATILRSVRKQFARLYIQRTDRYYLAMPKSLKMAKDVSSSGKFIDYDMEFEAKPWIIEDRINTISGTGIIDTGARFGGWTPTTILVTGTDITISGLTEQGQDTGTISISGYVENFVVDTEDFTSGNNAVITPKNYGIYVGPGKTYFTISGATSCIITYQNRWYL